ncbi:hypothetical protein PpBr36_07947 [Pyricularia pennisetigena]|uniref:hypothetical protein n=1 Tax=Pyricularia pennisetigena TaxID=1578925 RepID=UPI00114F26E9|nr:hypothetical protein PpBr36_07947 [Pyricularia pennisetigena]TLS25721.1 hypothetical protein PpBr36_07947 [Pyricularia pennisetigena]
MKSFMTAIIFGLVVMSAASIVPNGDGTAHLQAVEAIPEAALSLDSGPDVDETDASLPNPRTRRSRANPSSHCC